MNKALLKYPSTVSLFAKQSHSLVVAFPRHPPVLSQPMLPAVSGVSGALPRRTHSITVMASQLAPVQTCAAGRPHTGKQDVEAGTWLHRRHAATSQMHVPCTKQNWARLFY